MDVCENLKPILLNVETVTLAIDLIMCATFYSNQGYKALYY